MINPSHSRSNSSSSLNNAPQTQESGGVKEKIRYFEAQRSTNNVSSTDNKPATLKELKKPAYVPAEVMEKNKTAHNEKLAKMFQEIGGNTRNNHKSVNLPDKKDPIVVPPDKKGSIPVNISNNNEDIPPSSPSVIDRIKNKVGSILQKISHHWNNSSKLGKIALAGSLAGLGCCIALAVGVTGGAALVIPLLIGAGIALVSSVTLLIDTFKGDKPEQELKVIIESNEKKEINFTDLMSNLLGDSEVESVNVNDLKPQRKGSKEINLVEDVTKINQLDD